MDENRKITAAEALKKLDEVKNFIEVNLSNHLNMIFNESNESIWGKLSSKIKSKVILEVSLDLQIYFIYTVYSYYMKKILHLKYVLSFFNQKIQNSI